MKKLKFKCKSNSDLIHRKELKYNNELDLYSTKFPVWAIKELQHFSQLICASWYWLFYWRQLSKNDSRWVFQSEENKQEKYVRVTYRDVEKDIKICINKLLLVLLKEYKDYLVNIKSWCLNILSNIILKTF